MGRKRHWSGGIRFDCCWQRYVGAEISTVPGSLSFQISDQLTNLSDYEREYLAEGLQLSVRDEVLQRVVDGALKRELGARGLRAALVPYLEDAAYEFFGSNSAAVIELVVQEDEIRVRSS